MEVLISLSQQALQRSNPKRRGCRCTTFWTSGPRRDLTASERKERKAWSILPRCFAVVSSCNKGRARNNHHKTQSAVGTPDPQGVGTALSDAGRNDEKFVVRPSGEFVEWVRVRIEYDFA